MNINRVVKLIDVFYSLASEKLPPDSSNLKTILKNIENLETYQARIKYAEDNLDHLSSGSSRIVYQAPDKTIIKLAKNDKGIAQNKAEANPKMKSDFLNEIISKDQKGYWIQTYFLDKINEKEFENLTKISFEDFSEALSFGTDKSSSKQPKNFDKVSKTPVYKEMKRLCEDFDLVSGDVTRISSWGTKGNKPILIDAGLTGKIFEEFYEDEDSSS
jgi:hypothetical protein